MGKMVNIICDGCNKEFQKELRYVKVAEKKRKGKNYCNLPRGNNGIER